MNTYIIFSPKTRLNILIHIIEILCLYSALFSIFTLKCEAQSNNSSNRFMFHVMCNRYWKTDTTAFMEIETAFYPRYITMSKDLQGYHGCFDLLVLIQRKYDSSYVYVSKCSIPVKTQDSSDYFSGTIVNKMTYILECGLYTVKVYGSDSLNLAHRDSVVYDVNISRKPILETISDVELCSNISESINRIDEFYKNTYRVIPNPDLFYGSSIAPVIFSYAELYNLHKREIYLLKTEVQDKNGNIIVGRSHLKKYQSSDVVDVETLNITKIESGKYKYVLALCDTNNVVIAQTERPIFIYNPNIKKTDSLNITKENIEFAGMSDEKLFMEFQTARYIMNASEIQRFNKLTTIEARREFLSEFWSDVETGKKDQMTAISRSIYLQRVITANQRFNSLGRQGWKTDRGRVYILYAEPDEIERFPSESDSKPYEIWHYNQIENGVIFVFVDRTGFGEYVLVHSTKRGELQDDQWQRNLQ